MKNIKLIFSLIIVCMFFVLIGCDNKTVSTSSEHVHEFGEWEIVEEATCLEKGSKKRTCSCGEVETVEIDATGHQFGEWTVTKAATCLVDGEEKRTCSCGETETRVIEATGHEFGEWTVTKAATCLEKGSEERVCASCGEKETREIEIADHDLGELIDEVAATCMSDGVEAHYECSVCHKIFTPRGVETTLEALKVNKTGHTIEKYEVSLVTDASTLKAGDKIVLVSGDKGCATGSSAFTATITEGQLIPNTNFEVFTIANGTTEGTFALKLSSGKYVGAYKQDSYNLGTGNTSISIKTSYVITIDENGIATFTCQSEEADAVAKYIIYNAETDSFSRLTEGTSNVKIYKYELNDFHPYKAETCEEDGNYAYYECEYCDYIEKENGEVIEDATIPKTGHDLEATWEWAVDHSYARITIKCKNENDAILVERVKVRADRFSTASCTEAGEITYSVEYSFKGETFTDSYSEAVEAGHSYFLKIADTYVIAESYDSDTTYYTYNAEDEVYEKCEDLKGFEEGTDYYTLVASHNEYSTIEDEVTTYGCKLEYDEENSKYVLKYTCLVCGATETKDAVVKSVSEAKALTIDYTDLFLVEGIVVGPVHNGNRACLLIQDIETGEIYEVSGFATDVIYNSTSKTFTDTFEAGDKVVIPVQVKKYVCDGEADNNKLSLEAMLSYTNYDVANCVVSENNALKAVKNNGNIVNITSAEELEAFLFNEDDTYKTESVYKVVKLSGIISIFKGSNGYDIGMGDLTKSAEAKINSKTIRVRVGNTKSILGEEMDEAVFGQTLANGKLLFTGDLYLFYFGGTTGYIQFVIVSEEDAVARQIEKEETAWTTSWVDPSVNTYKVGKDYSLDGAKLVIDKYIANDVKDFVTTETIDVTSNHVVAEGTTYNKDVAGKYVVKVSVNGFEHEFEYEVKDKSLVSISAPTSEKVIVYYTDLSIESLIIDSYDITLSYDNETTENIDLTAEMLSVKDDAELADGDVTLVITYQGKTTEWEVTLVCDYYYVQYGLNNEEGLASKPVAGNVIILLDDKNDIALADTNDYKGSVEATVSNYIIEYDSKYAELTLVNGASDGTVAFKNEAGKYLLSGKSLNSAFGYQNTVTANTSYKFGYKTSSSVKYATIYCERTAETEITEDNPNPRSYLGYRVAGETYDAGFYRPFNGNGATGLASTACLRVFVKYSHTTGQAVIVNNN